MTSRDQRPSSPEVWAPATHVPWRSPYSSWDPMWPNSRRRPILPHSQNDTLHARAPRV